MPISFRRCIRGYACQSGGSEYKAEDSDASVGVDGEALGSPAFVEVVGERAHVEEIQPGIDLGYLAANGANGIASRFGTHYDGDAVCRRPGEVARRERQVHSRPVDAAAVAHVRNDTDNFI
jgi:hypothetical protein